MSILIRICRLIWIIGCIFSIIFVSYFIFNPIGEYIIMGNYPHEDTLFDNISFFAVGIGIVASILSIMFLYSVYLLYYGR